MSDNNTTTLESTFKSQDTEEWLDIHFTRPIGLLWANFFNFFNIHPNVVTILSIFLGAAAGYMFYFPDLLHTLLGIFFLIWANLYDSADGQLARMTGKKTRWGRILDGFAGDIWFFSIYFALSLRLQNEFIPGTDYTWGIWIWVASAFSGFICHGKQCQLADYYRNIHLFFLKGVEGSELDNFKKLRNELKTLSWKKDGMWMIFLYFYGNYTHSQECMTPEFQKFRKTLLKKYPNNKIPQTLCYKFRQGSLPLMKYANILTFNTRAIVLYFSLLIGLPWLYLLFEIIIMNILFFYMRYKHEALCIKLNSELSV